MRAAKKDPSPRPCRTCGLSPGEKRDDGTEVAFWPSQPHECIACIKARRQKPNKSDEVILESVDQGKRATMGALAEMDDQEDFQAETEDQRVEDQEPFYAYTCPEHGPHNGAKIGPTASSRCPVCEGKKRELALRAHYDLVKGAKEILTAYPWLGAWMDDERERLGLDNRWEALALAVAKGIDANWFKRFALRGSTPTK